MPKKLFNCGQIHKNPDIQTKFLNTFTKPYKQHYYSYSFQATKDDNNLDTGETPFYELKAIRFDTQLEYFYHKHFA